MNRIALVITALTVLSSTPQAQSMGQQFPPGHPPLEQQMPAGHPPLTWAATDNIGQRGEARRTDVSGAVKNVTRGGQGVSGLYVKLFRISGSNAVEEDSVLSDSKGKFRFRRVDYDPSADYRVATTYAGFPHASENIDFTSDPVEVNIAVHDTTSSDESISAERVHLIIQTQLGMLVIIEVHVLQNWGGIYIGSGPEEVGSRTTLRFELPEGATDFQVMPMGGDLLTSGVITDGNVISSTQYFRPGEQQVAFQYALIYDGGDMTFTKTIQYPTSTAMIVAQQNGPDIEVEGMQTRDEITRNNQKLLQFTTSGVKAGHVLTVHVSPHASAGRWFILVGGLGVLLVLGVMIVIRRGQAGSVDATAKTIANEVPDTEVGDSAQTLVDQIADLDEAYESDKVSDAEYLKKRKDLKASLVTTLREEE